MTLANEYAPRRMTLANHTVWVRDLQEVPDPMQREAFYKALEMHYGKEAAGKIRKAVERRVAA